MSTPLPFQHCLLLFQLPCSTAQLVHGLQHINSHSKKKDRFADCTGFRFQRQTCLGSRFEVLLVQSLLLIKHMSMPLPIQNWLLPLLSFLQYCLAGMWLARAMLQTTAGLSAPKPVSRPDGQLCHLFGVCFCSVERAVVLLSCKMALSQNRGPKRLGKMACWVSSQLCAKDNIE